MWSESKYKSQFVFISSALKERTDFMANLSAMFIQVRMFFLTNRQTEFCKSLNSDHFGRVAHLLTCHWKIVVAILFVNSSFVTFCFWLREWWFSVLRIKRTSRVEHLYLRKGLEQKTNRVRPKIRSWETDRQMGVKLKAGVLGVHK